MSLSVIVVDGALYYFNLVSYSNSMHFESLYSHLFHQ